MKTKIQKRIMKRWKGFTLIEMVIVITIIGILSSIAVTKYTKIQENAKKNADYATAANLATAAMIAISDGEQNVDVGSDGLLVNIALEDGYVRIKVLTPVLLTAIAELNHPRYMNVGKIFATKDKEITVFTANDLDVDASQIGLKGSPTKVKKSMTKEAKGAGEVVKESAPEAVSYVLGKLKEKHYI